MSQDTDTDRFGFDPQTGTYHAHYEWTDPDSVSEAVIASVAAVTGKDPATIGPLYQVIDPDALNIIVSPPQGNPLREGTCVAFTFEGCEVTVYWDGKIVIRPPDAG